MTTTVTTASNTATANGSSPIPFTFQALSAAEIGVQRNGVDVTTGFTITLNGDGTGKITPTSTWGTDTVTIYSNPSMLQSATFPRSGPLYPDQIESALDRLTRTGIALKRFLGITTAGPPGAAGAPGGNVMAIGLFSAASGIVIPAGCNLVQTSGRTVQGQYPARYVRSAAADQNLYTAQGNTLLAAIAGEGGAQVTAAQNDILAILNRIRFADSTGSYFEIEDSSQEVHAGHFGAVPDMAYNEGTGAITGTDSQPAIQALVDWRTWLKAGTPSEKKECLVPAGAFRCDRQVQLGYGDNPRKIVLVGAGASVLNYGGTTLAFTDPAQPGVSISGGLSSHVRQMALLSGGRAWYLNNNIGSVNDTAKAAGKDDRYMSGFWDPTLPLRSPRRRYAPHAAIAIDPYTGAVPNPTINAWAATTAYSTGVQVTKGGNLYICANGGTSGATGPAGVTDWIVDGTAYWHYVAPAGTAQTYAVPVMPAFLPAAIRIGYGRAWASTDAPHSDLWIGGFAVGMVVQPSGIDANGDFMSMRNVQILQTPVPLSIANSQARNNNLTRVAGNSPHTFITGLMHGAQNGRLSGTWTDVTISTPWQIFESQAQGGKGGIVAHNFYAEGVQRIGTILGGGSTASSFIFQGGDIAFSHQITNGKRGVPMSLLGNPASPYASQSPVIFVGTNFTGFKGSLTLDSNVQLVNCMVRSFEADGGPANQAQARFWNTTAGGVTFPFLTLGAGEQLINYAAADESNLGSMQVAQTNRRNTATSRLVPASMFTPSFAPLYGKGAEEIVNPSCRPCGQIYSMATGASFTTVSLSGRTLTMTANYGTDPYITNQWVPGAVLYVTNGMRFYITARTGAGPHTFTATLLNGFSYDNGGVISYEGGVPDFSAASPLSGYFVAGGCFTPNYPFFGDFTNTSYDITNVNRGDNSSPLTSTTVPVAINDTLWVDPYLDYPLGQPLRITGVTTGAYGTAKVTMQYPSSITLTKKRLPIWVRGS